MEYKTGQGLLSWGSHLTKGVMKEMLSAARKIKHSLDNGAFLGSLDGP
jgi:hypothetical protein